jgi:hypothetical protein
LSEASWESEHNWLAVAVHTGGWEDLVWLLWGLCWGSLENALRSPAPPQDRAVGTRMGRKGWGWTVVTRTKTGPHCIPDWRRRGTFVS